MKRSLGSGDASPRPHKRTAHDTNPAERLSEFLAKARVDDLLPILLVRHTLPCRTDRSYRPSPPPPPSLPRPPLPQTGHAGARLGDGRVLPKSITALRKLGKASLVAAARELCTVASLGGAEGIERLLRNLSQEADAKVVARAERRAERIRLDEIDRRERLRVEREWREAAVAICSEGIHVRDPA